MNSDNQQKISTVYDGSTITFRMLRALGWGPQLLNLGYYGFSGIFTFLNMRPGYLLLSIRQMALLAKTSKLLDLQPNDRVLDVACGRGQSSFYLSNLVQGLDVTGIDLLDENIKVSQIIYNNTRGLQYEKADAESTNYADNSFDKIMCLEAAFHFSNKQAFLDECSRILKPGGRLVVVDFCWKDASARDHVETEQNNFVKATWGYEDFYTKGEYLQSSTNSGFVLESLSDWTSKVTKPLLRQFNWLSKLGNNKWGRKLLALSNDQVRLFSRADWKAFAKSESAHNSVHSDSLYLAFVWKKP